MDKYKVLAIKKEDLENAISGLSGLKPILQKQVFMANMQISNDSEQAKKDSFELGNHFETAINAMITVLAMMED